MRTRKQKWTEKAVLCAVGILPVLWLALKIAPFTSNGLTGLLEGLPYIKADPFHFDICPASGKAVAVLLLAYGLFVAWYLATNRNIRPGEEYGSAQWVTPKSISKSLASQNQTNNIILTENVRIGTDNVFLHNLALILAVIGDSGSGKTRGMIMPNLMNEFGSYIILDPSGEILANLGGMLKKDGYEIRVLNLKKPELSNSFNPFHYVKSNLDVLELAEILWKATTDPKAAKGEPVWEESAKILFIALAELLYEFAIPEEQNLPTLSDLINEMEIDEQHPDKPSTLDLLFADCANRKPDSYAVSMYKKAKAGAGITIKSVKFTLEAHMGRITVPEIRGMLSSDNMFLERVSQEKTAIFCETPVADTSLNFIVSMLYQVLFTMLYRQGDEQADRTGSTYLPVPVFFMMDEFANVTVPADFQNRLSTMRKYGIGCAIVLQAINQIKALYEKDWESILGLCSVRLYLGGSEPSTHKYISETLGTETLDIRNYSSTKGRNGSTNRQDQKTGRKLLDPDEVGRLPRREAIVFVNGKPPVRDKKFDLTRHPRYRDTANGGADPFSYDANKTECLAELRYEPLTRSEKERAIDLDEYVKTFKKGEIPHEPE